MKTIDDIVTAASSLSAAQLLKLRKKLDLLERKLWEAESNAVTAKMKKAHITDEEIDRRVLRRRRESCI